MCTYTVWLYLFKRSRENKKATAHKRVYIIVAG